MNKIKHQHAEFLYIYYWRNKTNESNTGHIRSFVQLAKKTQTKPLRNWSPQRTRESELYKYFPSPVTVNAMDLPAKYLQSMSSGIKPVLKSSFGHFDRSTFSPFNAQRISKSLTNFFADVPFPLCNKLRKDFQNIFGHHITWINIHEKKPSGLLSAQYVCYGKPLKNTAAKHHSDRSCEMLW